MFVSSAELNTLTIIAFFWFADVGHADNFGPESEWCASQAGSSDSQPVASPGPSGLVKLKDRRKGVII